MRLDCAPISSALASLVVTLAVTSGGFSAFSFLMLATIYLPFTLVAATNRLGYLLILDAYQRVAIFVACCRASASSPFSTWSGAPGCFPFTSACPRASSSPSTTFIPITDGVGYLKSTGVPVPRTVAFSQALAFAILIELLLYFRRLAVLLLYGLAYVTSFSGTGALLLAVVAIPILVRLRRLWPLLAIATFLLAMPLLGNVPPFSFFMSGSTSSPTRCPVGRCGFSPPTG